MTDDDCQHVSNLPGQKLYEMIESDSVPEEILQICIETDRSASYDEYPYVLTEKTAGTSTGFSAASTIPISRRSGKRMILCTCFLRECGAVIWKCGLKVKCPIRGIRMYLESVTGEYSVFYKAAVNGEFFPEMEDDRDLGGSSDDYAGDLTGEIQGLIAWIGKATY